MALAGSGAPRGASGELTMLGGASPGVALGTAGNEACDDAKGGGVGAA